MANAKTQTDRPISPHLQIYSPMLTMMMSIFHRITGAALYFGTILFACWLVAAASGEDAFNYVSGLFATLPGKIVLFGYTWALIHHMLGGLRHLIWDTGRGFGLDTIELFARATIIGSLVLTALVWAFGLQVTGAL